MLDISVIQEDNRSVILLDGRLDVRAAAEADRRFQEIAQNAEGVLVDFSNLTYISSAGLRTLQRLRLLLKDKGLPLVVRGVKPEILDILEMTGLAAMFVFE